MVTVFAGPSRISFTLTLVPGAQFGNHQSQAVGVGDFLAVNGDDDIAGLDAGIWRRRVWFPRRSTSAPL